jgi:hypothetical protein
LATKKIPLRINALEAECSKAFFLTLLRCNDGCKRCVAVLPSLAGPLEAEVRASCSHLFGVA